MTDYKEIYILLFNKITETIESLQEIQQQTEEMYIAQEAAALRAMELHTKEWLKNKSNYLNLK